MHAGPLTQLSHLRRLSTAACLVGLVGCGTPSGVLLNPRACRQTYEFGNTGCVDIAGQVVGSGGQELAGISVGPGQMPAQAGFNSVYDETGTDGRFQLRLVRFGGQPPAAGPDTVSLYIRAVDFRSAGLGTPATVRDSVLVRVTVAPVGAVPEVATAVIRLPIP